MAFEFRAKSDHDPSWSVVHQCGDVCLSDILEQFAAFLRGCGFHFNGQIEIVEPEEDSPRSEDEEEINIEEA